MIGIVVEIRGAIDHDSRYGASKRRRVNGRVLSFGQTSASVVFAFSFCTLQVDVVDEKFTLVRGACMVQRENIVVPGACSTDRN